MTFWRSTPWMRRRSEIRAQIAAGKAARSRGDWRAAGAAFAAVAFARPHDHVNSMMLGEARRNAGDLDGAIKAFEAAIAVRPWRPEGHLQLGNTLKMAGRRNEAIAALSQAAELSKAYPQAQRGLLGLGLRQTAAAEDLEPAEQVQAFASLQEVRRRFDDSLRNWETLSTFPPEAWDAFRRAFPVPATPWEGPVAERAVLVVIDAAHAAPSYLRSTLLSLLNQTWSNWRALVLAGAETQAHTVAGLAEIDDRIVFATRDGADIPQTPAPDSLVASLSAGAVLDVSALEWLVMAAARTGASAVYCDHDHAVEHWRNGYAWSSPVLQPVADPFEVAGTQTPPALALFDAAFSPILFAVLRRDGAAASVGLKARRAVLLAALARGPVAHVPIALASVLDLPEVAGHGLAAEREVGPGYLHPVTTDLPDPAPPGAASDARLCLVVPTRDQAKLLQACLETARATAARPDLLTINVVDNRSTAPDALALMRSQEAAGAIRIVPADRAFNWSSLNNLAVRDGDHDILVFANNDVEFLTSGWDDRLRHLLAREEVGAVGARLLYPDRRVQHVGVALGLDHGPPVHEGVGFPETDGGPLDRWRRTRGAAAVTGAFLAVRRAVFDEIGGFDEVEFAIGYNDIDFCLRVREAGRLVVFDAAIELIHHESASRGFNDTKARVAWDQGELTSLHHRWGEAMFVDPSLNPQWAGTGQDPFAGYRNPGVATVMAHIDASARTRPWAVVRSAG